jgi:DNA repair ATPase RecN
VIYYSEQLFSSDISAVVGATKFRGTRGDSDAVAEESAENIIREIVCSGGVAIPAHIDVKAGLCQITSSNTIKQACELSNAVEIIYPDKDNEPSRLSRFNNLGLDLPSIIGSDSHHPNDIDRAYTWVKMSTPSIDGLKLALVDGVSSLIRSDTELGNPNQYSNTTLHAITIKNTKYAGRKSPLEITFNPWLNSIIGGRGSGKSSVLEFIRIGMDRSKDLTLLKPDNEIRRSFESFIKTSTSRESDGVLLDNSEISCIYIRDNVEYRLNWDNQTNSVSILRKDNDSWILENGEAHSRFPIKIFSQKQIFDLAKNPNALLKLMDESSIVKSQQWKMDWKEKCSHFLTLSSQIRELKSRLSNKGILLGQLSDVEQKLKTLENSDNKEIFSLFQQFSTKRSLVEKLENEIDLLTKDLSVYLSSSKISEIESNTFDVQAGSELQVVEYMNILSAKVALFKTTIETAGSELENELSQFKLWYASSDFNHQHIAIYNQYHDLMTTLNAQGVNNPADYSKLIDTKNSLIKSIAELSAIESKIEDLKIQINSAYASIVELRGELTSNRLEFLQEHINEHSGIKIEITPLGDVENIDYSFREVIGRLDGAFSSDIFDSDKKSGFLFKLNQTISNIDPSDDLPLRFSALHEFKGKLFNYNAGDISGEKLGKRFIDFMNQQQPQKFDELNLWFPDDKLTIKFHDGKKFKDVSQGSAGQKASAILSFLLSYGTEPLILDQPEDDLDNGLITNLIVSKLHESKSKRQIIVVTHNPNIVVNGDSEYVIALADKGQIIQTASGALQEVNVRNNVCEIMEGGALALQKRYKRMLSV